MAGFAEEVDLGQGYHEAERTMGGVAACPSRGSPSTARRREGAWETEAECEENATHSLSRQIMVYWSDGEVAVRSAGDTVSVQLELAEGCL